ncbi:DIL domain-containing protein [Abortiporus biennis]|nr:DIL domain-containing protein [Abortiporus biennis]
MASSSTHTPVDFTVEPDLQPLYPTPAQISHILSPNVGLSPSQKQQLVSHCLTRACVFGDLSLLSYLLSDPQAQTHLDLGKQDEDGLGLISMTILGFGSEGDRDVEREECVRMLIAEGADVNIPDHAGWISLHHAALLAPPTLVSHLLTHGCSPLAVTRRNLSALDIVTASSTLPGREDVALLLEEAMREKGWTGGRMEERRRTTEKRMLRLGKRRDAQASVGKILGIDPKWWGETDFNYGLTDLSEEDDEESVIEDEATPPLDYTSMLVFSPQALPDIFQSLISDFRPTPRNAEPANSLYMLSRFACLNCDHNWVEDLILGATDTIEETIFNHPDELTHLVFWLYNLTVWLHLMRCDESIRETLEYLDSFGLIEEILNSVFVFIIRFAERKVDQLLDAALLDFSPLSSEFESIQFESEWSFLRSFGTKKKSPQTNGQTSTSPPPKGSISPSPSSRPPSPPPSALPTSKGGSFASLRQTFSRSRTTTSTPIQALFADTPPSISPKDITSFMTAFQTFLTLSDINPVIITQFWSQVMYWTACESFNRILTRKKYLCRSRALQISMNLSVIEEWIGQMGLPRGIGSHFAPVRDLLNWLQCLSSITEFPNLIATIQNMRNLNPLQMRRAVRDYKYEVNEGRMNDECTQYLAQLQKDWERHRVKIGVEALRKEVGDREREREGTASPPLIGGTSSSQDSSPSSSPPPEVKTAQRNIDSLFDRSSEKSNWEPARPPEVLGELLDSRHMLPLLLPSDPRLLGAVPSKNVDAEDEKRNSVTNGLETQRSASRASSGSRGAMAWRVQTRKLREISMTTLQWVDGALSAARWYRPMFFEDEEEEKPPPYSSDDPNPTNANGGELDLQPGIIEHLTPLTRKRSARQSRGRPSVGDDMMDMDMDMDG